MASSRHPFRKFVFASAARSADGLHYALIGVRHGRPIRLEPAEFALASLIDGARDAAAVRQAALASLGIELGADELERFCNELAIGDLLAQGTQEPLPVPAITDGEAAVAGWSKGTKPLGVAPESAPPSTVPGALVGAGLPGSLNGLWGAFRGAVAPPRIRVPVGPVLPAGGLLNLPMAGGAMGLMALLALVIAALVVMWTKRIEMGVDVARLIEPWPLLLTLFGGALLMNFLSEVARAAAIRSLTRSVPTFGIVLGIALIPRFHTDTRGAAESAPREQRLRIVGSPLVAQLTVLVLAVGLWLVFQHSHSILPSLMVALALLASAFFLLQINPLVKRDGYNWLVQYFGASDLREQALFAVMNYERPWNELKPLSPTVLRGYFALCVLYLFWMLVWLVSFPGRWLTSAFGGVGVVIIVLLLAWSVFVNARRTRTARGSIGAGKLNLERPRKIDGVIIAILVVVALFPYTYAPSGAFTVLPSARADVRALAAGDIREVLVKEGDQVAQGQVIARIADDEARTAVVSSEAVLARLRANLSIAQKGAKTEEVEQSREELATAQKKLEFSYAESERLKQAFTRRAVSDQEYQRARQVAALDQQRVAEARRKLALVASPVRAEQVQAIEAEITREQALLDLHRTAVDNAQIKAPIAGRVLSGELRYAVGGFLQKGDLLATIEDAAQLLVEIRLPETEVGIVAPGARAWARAWAFPDGGYSGTVREIAPSAEKNDYGKVVRVVMAIDQPDGKLLPEMTGYAKIETPRVPLIVAFTRPLLRFFLIEFWSWLP